MFVYVCVRGAKCLFDFYRLLQSPTACCQLDSFIQADTLCRLTTSVTHTHTQLFMQLEIYKYIIVVVIATFIVCCCCYCCLYCVLLSLLLHNNNNNCYCSLVSMVLISSRVCCFMLVLLLFSC